MKNQTIDTSKIIELYEMGMTQVEIAEELGVTQKLIWGRLRKANYKCRIAKKRDQIGINNDSWKGEKVGYSAFHRRLEATRGRPKKCEVCGTNDSQKTYDWANLTGHYDDPKDYKRMCRSCHWKYDGKINNIKHMRKEVAGG